MCSKTPVSSVDFYVIRTQQPRRRDFLSVAPFLCLDWKEEEEEEEDSSYLESDL